MFCYTNKILDKIMGENHLCCLSLLQIFPKSWPWPGQGTLTLHLPLSLHWWAGMVELLLGHVRPLLQGTKSCVCPPVWLWKLCNTEKDVLTSSHVGTLFSFSLILSHSTDSRFHAMLSRICSSMWFRCFTTSRQRPSSALMKTSITCAVDNYDQHQLLLS